MKNYKKIKNKSSVTVNPINSEYTCSGRDTTTYKMESLTANDKTSNENEGVSEMKENMRIGEDVTMDGTFELYLKLDRDTHNVNLTLKDADQRDLHHVTGKPLFNGTDKTLFVGDVAIEVKDNSRMTELLFEMADDGPYPLLMDGLEIRKATEQDLANAMSFQASLQDRIRNITPTELHTTISRFEDTYLASFDDAMREHRGEDDATLADYIIGAQGYPYWFDLFDSLDGVIETVMMFVKKFRDEQ